MNRRETPKLMSAWLAVDDRDEVDVAAARNKCRRARRANQVETWDAAGERAIHAREQILDCVLNERRQQGPSMAYSIPVVLSVVFLSDSAHGVTEVRPRRSRCSARAVRALLQGVRNRALIAVLWRCGLRISEALAFGAARRRA
ncbi:MAG: hypothetical protein JOZ07_11135 [Solirubrobacterales bacterium]|nr:hypothetical protein [Solirubrobacterales bacterium]